MVLNAALGPGSLSSDKGGDSCTFFTAEGGIPGKTNQARSPLQETRNDHFHDFLTLLPGLPVNIKGSRRYNCGSKSRVAQEYSGLYRSGYSRARKESLREEGAGLNGGELVTGRVGTEVD